MEKKTSSTSSFNYLTSTNTKSNDEQQKKKIESNNQLSLKANSLNYKSVDCKSNTLSSMNWKEMKHFTESYTPKNKVQNEFWKKEELKKLTQNINLKDAVKKMIEIEKNYIKKEREKDVKTNLANINYSKLNSTAVQFFPKIQKTQEIINQKYKSFIGKDKYPLDTTKDDHLDVPKTNYIYFETLTDFMKNFRTENKAKNTFETQILESFQKIKSVYAKSSIDRRDMLGLAQWLDKTSENILENRGLSLEEKLENIQKSYTLGMQEIVEIIAKECNERGLIVRNIWNVHVNLVNACISKLENEKSKNYSNFLKEIDSLKDQYKNLLDNLMKENRDYKNQLNSRDFNIKKLTNDNIYLKKTNSRLKKSLEMVTKNLIDLKDLFNSTLQENIKLKLSKEADYTLRKGERDLLKKQYDEMVKKTKDEKDHLITRLEKLTRSPTHEYRSRNSINIDDNFSFAITPQKLASLENPMIETINSMIKKNTIFEEEEKRSDSDSEDEEMLTLFVKEIGVDTKDLLPVNNKETSTKELQRLFSKEREVQTVFFDEIEYNEDNDEISSESLSKKKEYSQSRDLDFIEKFAKKSFNIHTELIGDVVLQNGEENSSKPRSTSPDHNFFIRKRMFSFSQASLHHLDKFKEIESYTLKGISDWFSKEINVFYDTIESIINDYNDGTLKEKFESYNWVEFNDLFKASKLNTEQFLKNILNRDTARSKEMLQHKIDLLERKIEMEEFERIGKQFKTNYDKLRTKFEEFFKQTIQIQSNEIEEDQPKEQVEINIYDGSSKLNPDILEIKNKPKRRKSLSLIQPFENNQSMDLDDVKKKGKTIVKKPIDSKMKNSIRKMDDSAGKKQNMNASTMAGNALPSINLTLVHNNTDLNISKSINEVIFEERQSFIFNLEDSENLNKNINDKKKQLTCIVPKKILKETKEVNGNEEIKKFFINMDKSKKEALDQEQKYLKEKNIEHYLNENMIDLINQTNALLPHKKKWAKIQSLNSDKCSAFLHRIEASSLTSSKSVILSTVIKTISQIYSELVKQINVKNGYVNPLFFILYEYLYQKYGNSRERAESKMLKIFQGCLNNVELPRVRLFAKLLSIYNSKIKNFTGNDFYDGNDLNFYLTYLCQLDDHPVINLPGIVLAMSPHDHIITGLNKALDVFSKYCSTINQSGIIPKIKIENIINQIKSSKIDDPIISRKYVVDVDMVIEKIFEVRDEIYLSYALPFVAVDLDFNQALNINEFTLLLRNLEKKNIKEKEIINIFNKEYDFIDEELDEKCISFKRFAFICQKKNFCSLKKQEEFMKSHSDEIINIEQLRDEFDVKKNLIKLKLMKTNYFNSFYSRLIKIIEKSLANKKLKDKDENLIWMQYRIIDEESNNLLLEYEIESTIPKEFNLLNHTFNNLI